MRLKKMLSIVMSAGLCIMSLTGCSSATNNYMKEFEEAQKWTGCSSDISGNILLEADGEKIDLNITASGCNSGNKGMSKVKITDKSGNFNLPEIECYVDSDGTTYINKSYFTDLYLISGEKIPDKLASLNAEFIGMDLGTDIKEMQQLTSDPKQLMKLVNTLFKNSDVDLPIKQNGREYSIKMNSDEMIEYGAKLMKAGVNNLDSLNGEFNLGLSAQDIEDIKNSTNNCDEMVNSLKDLIKGSSVDIKQTFDNNNITVLLNLDLKIKDNANITISINETCKKTDLKEIKMPSNSIKLTGEQYAELLAA